METKLHINQIENRQYVLSPAIQSGNDRECVNKDFYQQGDNSSVYVGKLGLAMKVVHRKTNIPYTIIHFEKEKVSKLKLQKKINSTLDLMYKSSHPYMFRLLNHYETQTHVFMIFEEYDGDSLDNKILKGRCDLHDSKKYLVEVMLGVQHMHLFNLYNLNVNPENILFTECIKLTDYGLKMEGKNEKPKRVTIIKKKDNINYLINAYTSPEELGAILTGKPCIVNGKTDSWNCGILLYEMLTCFQSPFKGNTNEEIIDAILNCKIDLSPIKDAFCRDLISKLVRKNPEDRISIDEVLNMEEIKNIDIEQPEIDFSDNIINPIDEQEFLKNMSENQSGTNNQISTNKTQEYQKTMINLKNENDSLKKIVEDLRKQVVSSSNKKKGTKHISKLKSMVIDAGGEFATDENEAQNLGEILEDENTPNKGEEKDKKENKIEEIKKGVKNEIIEEEDEDDDDEEFSEKEDEYDDDNLFVRCEKYKERNKQLKEKLSKMYKKNKTMKSLLDQYKKENNTLKSEKNKNILETLSKMNTVPIYEINDLVNVIMNSINIFKSSANDFKKALEKLINVSDEKYNNLNEENKKYIDGKTKLFFDIMNNKITDVEAYNKLNSVNVEEKTKKTENIVKNNNNNICKNEDYNKKYDEWKKREGELLQKIRESEEKFKSKNELYSAEKKSFEEFKIQFNEIATKWQNSEKNIQDLKEFINEKVDKNEAKKFFERIKV
jgi:serine/threonine protein kinase